MRRTLSREWVAHEFGITYLIHKRQNRHHTIITIFYSGYKSGRLTDTLYVHVVHRSELILIYAATVVYLGELPEGPRPHFNLGKKGRNQRSRIAGRASNAAGPRPPLSLRSGFITELA